MEPMILIEHFVLDQLLNISFMENHFIVSFTNIIFNGSSIKLSYYPIFLLTKNFLDISSCLQVFEVV